jgi:hypothetical protein
MDDEAVLYNQVTARVIQVSADVTAMITAIVGVLGTLSAPLLLQRMSVRQGEQQAAADERRRHFEERRAAYTTMNRACREFNTMLKDALHRIRDSVYSDSDRAEVENIRRTYRDRYAEIQMIVPERVIDAVRTVNRILAEADAATKRLDRGIPRDNETPELVMAALKDVEPKLTELTYLMRTDLGVED